MVMVSAGLSAGKRRRADPRSDRIVRDRYNV